MQVFQWLAAHWQTIAVAVLTIDAALIPLFPDTPLLVQLKNFLSALVGPKAT